MAEDLELEEDDEEEDNIDLTGAMVVVERPGWRPGEHQIRLTVPVDMGRGNIVEVPVGSPFVETLERLAEEAHYGGFFRVFVNGNEVINPTDAPQTFEPGMRTAVASYDKVGV